MKRQKNFKRYQHEDPKDKNKWSDDVGSKRASAQVNSPRLLHKQLPITPSPQGTTQLASRALARAPPRARLGPEARRATPGCWPAIGLQLNPPSKPRSHLRGGLTHAKPRSASRAGTREQSTPSIVNHCVVVVVQRANILSGNKKRTALLW